MVIGVLGLRMVMMLCRVMLYLFINVCNLFLNFSFCFRLLLFFSFFSRVSCF